MSSQRQGDIESQIRSWAADAIAAEVSGNEGRCQLIAKAQYLTTTGNVEASERPSGGMESWLADLDIYFPDAESDMGLYAARILDAIEARSPQRLSLGDATAMVTWRETDGDSVTEPPNAPAGFPFKATVYLGVQVI